MGLIADEAQRLVEMGLPEHLVEDMIPAFVAVNDNTVEMTESMRALGDVVDAVAAGFAQQAGAMLGAALAGDKAHLSMHNLLKTLSQSALAQALYETAIGIAALTPWGAQLYGPPGPHFQAAAVFGAAGAALGLAASMAGGGDGGGSRSQGTTGQPIAEDIEERQVTEQRQEVTVIVEGAAFVQDEEAFARTIKDTLERQDSQTGRG
jgi:hypothetical protein